MVGHTPKAILVRPINDVIFNGVALLSAMALTEEKRVRDAFVFVEPNRGQLGEIAPLIDGGANRPIVETAYPLAQVRQAYERASHGGMRDKIVLQVAGDSHEGRR